METPIRHQSRDLRYIKARVEGIDLSNKVCRCASAFSEAAEAAPVRFDLAYDYLVLSPGCTNHTFGTPGVAVNAMFVRTARDAKAIQAHIRNCFEKASIPGLSGQESQCYPSLLLSEAVGADHSTAERDMLHFVIVGAGPTGVEVSSELSDLFRGDYARLYPHVKKYVRISIHDTALNVLGGFDQHLQEYAMTSFDKRDVEVFTGSHIEKIDDKAIYTKELGRIPCGAVIWSAGNKATDLVEALRCKKSENGMPRMLTDDFLRLKIEKGGVYPDVFALGDAADIEGSSLPTTAEVACQKANWLAAAINKDFDEAKVGPFEYKQTAIVAYLGHNDGVIAGKSDYTGAEAWLAWRSKNFLWTRTWRQRVMLVISWMLDRMTGKVIAPR